MAMTSIGFNGTVSDLQWAKLAPLLGTGLLGCVDASASLAVTAVAGFRRAQVAAGTAGACGVATTLDAPASPGADMPAPAAGQWHLLVLRRVWASSTTTLETLAGPTTTNTAQTVAPATFPAALLVAPGVQADQPLAWLWVNVTTTAVAVFDLRKLPNTDRVVALESRATTIEGAATTLRGRVDAVEPRVTTLEAEKRNRKLDGTNALVSTITQYGIGKIDGDSTSGVNETLVFPVAFASTPVVVVSGMGYRTSGTFNHSGTAGGTPMVASASAASATQCQVYLENPNGASTGTGYDYYYAWIAVGTAT